MQTNGSYRPPGGGRTGADAQIEKVEDIMQIMMYNVVSTPAVVVDGEVRIKGRIPSLGEVKAILN